MKLVLISVLALLTSGLTLGSFTSLIQVQISEFRLKLVEVCGHIIILNYNVVLLYYCV